MFYVLLESPQWVGKLGSYLLMFRTGIIEFWVFLWLQTQYKSKIKSLGKSEVPSWFHWKAMESSRWLWFHQGDFIIFKLMVQELYIESWVNYCHRKLIKILILRQIGFLWFKITYVFCKTTLQYVLNGRGHTTTSWFWVLGTKQCTVSICQFWSNGWIFK
jgi:hypothetical protein